jgi:subtilisin family serine protease
MLRSKLNFSLIALLVVIAVPLPTSGQTQEYPPEFSPTRTSRPRPLPQSVVPLTKFVRAQNAIPNRYIVVLEKDVVSDVAPLSVRRAQVSKIATKLAGDHFGKIGFIYETALIGFSVELPNEGLAVALSESPQVKWVEEVGRLQLAQTQPNPPWGLDAIDGSIPVGPVNATGRTTGVYAYNRTGAGVVAYVLDTGIRRTHLDFGNRASIAADFIFGSPFLDQCVFPKPHAGDNDCSGHGTHVAGTLGGATYGAAKEVTIRSVKVCTGNFWGCPPDVVIAGINWVTSQHNANPSVPAVANMSLGGPLTPATDTAVTASIASGVTYVVAAGNNNDDVRFYSPGHIPETLAVGSIDAATTRVFLCPGGGGSNFGRLVDLFAPGYFVVSAWPSSDTAEITGCGTSMASPHVAGAVATYLQGRVGMANCGALPIQGPSSPVGSAIATCPDRVARFVASNANLQVLNGVNGTDHNGVAVTTPNRLLYTANLSPPLNPIDNQRFFVWQHYADFLPLEPEPDESGLNFWTGQITNICGTTPNTNNSCTHIKRIDVSRAFWAAQHPSAFQNNAQFVQLCYQLYLRRSVPTSDSGYQFWLGVLNSYGSPANPDGHNHLIDAFLSSAEYRQRFGQP